MHNTRDHREQAQGTQSKASKMRKERMRGNQQQDDDTRRFSAALSQHTLVPLHQTS